MVQTDYDDPDGWLEATQDKAGNVDHAEAADLARKARGHYYYVNDALDEPRTVLVDGYYAAMELERVPEFLARLEIGRQRRLMDALPEGERFLRRVEVLLGSDAADAFRRGNR